MMNVTGIRKIVFTLLIIISTSGLEAVLAQTGSIEGTIIDASSEEPLIGATISLAGTSVGTSTNPEGEYYLRNLPEGNQTFKISFLGYHTQEIEITINARETLEYNIELEPDVVEGEEVVVQSQALAQANAIQRQLLSNTIVNVVSESRLRELPDVNAAESVGRLPGVSIIRDAGEANKVAIRGLGPQYNSVTIDGDRVTGTDLGSREVDMSMISPEMLSGIEVYKVLRPDMDADAIGGSVNFSFSGAPRESQFRASLSSGYHGQINGIGSYEGSASGSGRFFNGRLGIMGTVSSESVDRSSHVFSANYNILRSAREGEPHAPIETNSVDLTDRQETRGRHGAGLNLDLNILGGNIYSNNFYSLLNRDEVSTRRAYNVAGNRQIWHFRDREINISVLNTSVGGEHEIHDGVFNVDWRVSRNVSAQEQPYDNRVSFNEINALNRDLYTVGIPPEEIPDVMYNNLDGTELFNLDHAVHEAEDRDLTASLNIEVPFQFGTQFSGDIRMGGKHYNKDRYRESRGRGVRSWMYVSRYQSYDIITDDDFPFVASDYGGPAIAPFVEDASHSILDGNYDMRLNFNREQANWMWDNHGDLYYHNPSTRLNDHDVTEKVNAAYIMTELNIGKKLMVLPGVRYEHENADYAAVRKDFTLEWPGDAAWDEHEDRLEDVSINRQEGMWFPMVQARYRITDNFDIRAARTQSTSRPSYHQRSPRRIINSSSRTVSRGQPKLVLPKAVNYDAFFTVHSNRIGLVTVGGFYKEIENLIFNRQTVVIDPEEMELPDVAEGYTIFEPLNNSNLTTVRGVEMEWQSNLTWLPSPFNGLVIDANFSSITSEAEYPGFKTERTSEGVVVIDTFRVAPMVHQPDFIANISVGYDYKDFSLRLSTLYQGATLTSVSSTRPELDQFTEDYLRWDLSIKQDLFGGLASVFVNAQNLTNRRDYSTQFTEEYPRAMEYYGWNLNMGLRLQL